MFMLNEQLDKFEVQDTLLLRDILDIALASSHSLYERSASYGLNVSPSGVCQLTTQICFRKNSGDVFNLVDTNNCVHETGLISHILYDWLSFNLMRPSFTVYPICLQDDLNEHGNTCQFGLCYMHYKDSSCPTC